MRKLFHLMSGPLPTVVGVAFLTWGLTTCLTLKRIPPLPDDAVYFCAPSLLEILGVDEIQIRWTRLAFAVAGTFALWVSLLMAANRPKNDHDPA